MSMKMSIEIILYAPNGNIPPDGAQEFGDGVYIVSIMDASTGDSKPLRFDVANGDDHLLDAMYVLMENEMATLGITEPEAVGHWAHIPHPEYVRIRDVNHDTN